MTTNPTPQPIPSEPLPRICACGMPIVPLPELREPKECRECATFWA
jgi:hypothetical protein